MKKMSLIFAILLICGFSVKAQEKPRLVVGIVVDQMRMDYIYRFSDRFGDDGFKRLMSEGYTFHNAHYNYVPTSTAPGHTSIYTGTTPANHGIIGNNWYDKTLNESVYCASDDSYASVGTTNNNGRMSPHRLQVTTLTDQLKLHDKESIVIGISIKDRGAIFPAGNLGEAYWYDNESGNFITSTYYMDELPKWVDRFNNKNLSKKYLRETWRPLERMNTYTASGPDESPYEKGLLGKTTFPYDLSDSEWEGYEIIKSTPFGNDILTDLAVEALEKTDLGDDEHTDILSVSFSSTDYIGHNFGPRSVEVEDTYLRLDKNIAMLLDKLDREVGKGNYVVFLSSDHGVADVPQYLMDNHVPAGYLTRDGYSELNEFLADRCGEGEWVRALSGNQIYLNHDLIRKNGINLVQLRADIAEFIRSVDGVAAAYTADQLISGSFNESGVKGMYIRGYNQERSGDVAFALRPGWLSTGNHKGSSHGSAYRYDTHVPMIFFGNSVRQGSSHEYRTITDIAPTVSAIIGITMPNAATGDVLGELIDKRE